MSFGKASLTRGHILLEGMSYRKMCLIGGHVLWEDMHYGRTCLLEDVILLLTHCYISIFSYTHNHYVIPFIYISYIVSLLHHVLRDK